MERATISAKIQSTLISQNLISIYPVDISAETQMMCIYLDIIFYQVVDDTKAPLLRVIELIDEWKTVMFAALNQIIAKFLAT